MTKQTAPRKDRILRATARNDTVRITLADATDVVCEARRIHSLSRTASAALGRQLVMTAIMACELKNEDDRLSTILRGGGPAGSMICTGDAALHIKGSLQNGDCELPPNAKGKLDVSGFVGTSGKLTVITDLGLKEPYVGVCNLVSGEIAEDFAEYYAASLQQPVVVYLGVRVQASSGEILSACGALIEPMPGCSEETLDLLQEKTALVKTMSARVAEGASLETILNDWFEKDDQNVMGERTPVYHCDCSRERIERALLAAGEAEIRDMIETDGGAEVECRFCRKKYVFTAEDLTQLLPKIDIGG